MQAQEQHSYSQEEYLKLEEAAESKSEYYNGQIFPMAGGTPNHNRIAVNLGSAMNVALTDQDYDVFISNIAVPNLVRYKLQAEILTQPEYVYPIRRETAICASGYHVLGCTLIQM